MITYTATIYGKSINGKTITELFRKASRIANNYHNVIDTMVVIDSSGISCKFNRINRKYPNGIIERGKWK